MNDYQKRLTNLLLEKNNYISYWQARTWIKVLWHEIEATYPHPNWYYQAKAVEKVIREWILQYGDQIHELVDKQPDLKRLFTVDKKLLH